MSHEGRRTFLRLLLILDFCGFPQRPGHLRVEPIEVVGIDCHIGSQLTELEPFRDALDRVLDLVDRLAESGIQIEHLDLGGGLGVRYRDEEPPTPQDWAKVVRDALRDQPYEIQLEPGRAISGNAGVMLTRGDRPKNGRIGVAVGMGGCAVGQGGRGSGGK